MDNTPNEPDVRGTSHGDSPPVSPAAITEQLDRILASRTMANSGRLSRLLRYLVEAALTGQDDKLTEQNIGKELFGQSGGFDPRTDSTVRVQAHRLRNRLYRYYTIEGIGDGLIIELPRGSYTPAFHVSARVVQTAAPAGGRQPWWLWAGACLLVVAGLALALVLVRLPRDTLKNPETGRHFRDGMYLFRLRNADRIRRSALSFERVVKLAPEFPRGHAMLAEVCALMAFRNLGPLPASELYDKVEVEANAALALSSTLPAPHAALGVVHAFRDRDWTAAEADFRRALMLDPQLAVGHVWYCQGLASRGRFEEAITECRNAIELDPQSYLAAPETLSALVYAGRYDEAIAQGRHIIDLNPGAAGARTWLGVAYACAGDYAAARAELERAASTSALEGLYFGVPGRLGYVCAKLGDQPGAQRMLEQLERLPAAGGVPLTQQAYVYAGLHDQRLFAALEAALRRRETESAFLAVEPFFGEYRDDARFRALLKSAGLAR